MIKLTGRDGRLLVLRPDCTTPIARIVATQITAPVSRLFYSQSVYRTAAFGRGENYEITQCGIELFGVEGAAGDAEVLTLAIDALLAAKVTGFHIELGGLPNEQLIAITNALQPEFAKYLRFEPELSQDIDYYTGLVFRAYAAGAGHAVLAGGRYDRLVGDFGKPMPAVGFAVYADEILAIKPETSLKLQIAVTKGRLLDDTLELLKRSGFDAPASINDKDDRRLVHDIPNSNISLVLAKAADVLTYVEHGVCQLGIVGRDTLLEQGGELTEILDLGFGRCKFAVAASAARTPGKIIRTVASKYPNVAKGYFTQQGTDVEVIKIDGSVELAPLLGLADAIVDIVSTGGTLKANGLEVVADVAEVTARLIANPAALRLRKQEITEFVGRVSGK
jgi:ATP phosphoribosyltransferase regulatory subunit